MVARKELETQAFINTLVWENLYKEVVDSPTFKNHEIKFLLV